MRRLRIRGMRLAIAVAGAQLMIGLIGAAALGGVYGSRAAVAALLGAVIAAVPGFYMALHVLPERASNSARQAARRLVLGQLGKLFLTGGLFLAAVLIVEQHFAVLLVTYVVCLACYWPALKVTR